MRRRVQWTRSLERWPRSLGQEKSALTPSIPAWWKQKEQSPAVTPKATCAKVSKRKHLSVASVNPTTSGRPRSSSRRTIPTGSPARRCLSREVFVSHWDDGYDLIHDYENEGGADQQTGRGLGIGGTRNPGARRRTGSCKSGGVRHLP